MNTGTSSPKQGVFWAGWRQVGLAATMDFAATGFFFYSWSVFLPQVEKAFELSRGEASLGLSLMIAVSGLAAVFVGRLVDTKPLHLVLSTGGVLCAAGLVWIGVSQHVLMAVLGIAILGIGLGFLGLLAPARLVTNWFIAKRSTALGLAGIGISASGVLMPLVASYLIELDGWRFALFCYAGIAAGVIVPLAFFGIVTKPEDKGLGPDNMPPQLATEDEVAIVVPQSMTAKQILLNPMFLLLIMVFGSQFFAVGSVIGHIYPMAQSRGLDPADSAQIAALIALMAVGGKLFFGFIGDRLQMHWVMLLSASVQLTGLVLAALVPGLTGMGIMVVLFGFGYGGAVILQSLAAARYFGANMGAVLGYTRPVGAILQTSGPPLAGFLYDYSGSYEPALWMNSFAVSASILGVFLFYIVAKNMPVPTTRIDISKKS